MYNIVGGAMAARNIPKKRTFLIINCFIFSELKINKLLLIPRVIEDDQYKTIIHSISQYSVPICPQFGDGKLFLPAKPLDNEKQCHERDNLRLGNHFRYRK